MKHLFLVLTLSSCPAFADIGKCTSTLNAMTQLTLSYTQVLKSCSDLELKGETNGRFYEGYRRIARDLERVHNQAALHCAQTCEDKFFCEGELSGACEK